MWEVFTRLYDLIAVPLTISVDQMIAAATSYINPVFRAALVAFVAGRLLWQALVQNNEPLNEATKLIIYGAIALSLIGTVGGYGPWARDVLLNGLGPEVSRALAGTLGNRPISGIVFDEIAGKAFTSGLVIYRALPWSMAGLALCFLVVIYWVAAAIAIAIAFLVWMKAFIVLCLLVGFGPIVAGLWVFPLFRGLALGWLNVVLANIVLQILATALLALLLSAETQMLSHLSTLTRTGAGGAMNEIMGVQVILAGMILFVACGWLVYQLPGTAAAMTGGFAGYGISAARWVQDTVRGLRGDRGGHTSAPAAATQQVTAAPLPTTRPAVPVGRSISNP